MKVLGEGAPAFGAWDDGAASPYLLAGPDTATTLRVRDGKTLLGDGPFSTTGEFIAGIDVASCADRQQAIQLAAAHPAVRDHAIEVRPFQKG